MNTLAPNIKNISNPSGFTTLIESNMFDKENTVGQRLISWNEINFSERWKDAKAIPPKPIINRTIEQIVEMENGYIYLNFRKNK